MSHPIKKPRIQYLEEMIDYRFRMQEYYFALQDYERLMKERLEVELHMARGGPLWSIPNPPDVPPKPFRPSEYMEPPDFPIWQIQLTP